MTEEKKTEALRKSHPLWVALENRKTDIAQLLPKHLTVDRFLKTVNVAVARQPKLLECHPANVMEKVLACAEMGLDPSGTLGHVYLIPYNIKGVMTCQLIIGYQGWIELMRRSGTIRKIEARAVYPGDEFAFEFGLEPKLVHRPSDREPGALPIAFYCVATLADGEKQFDVMSKDEVDAIRARSRAKDNGPWVTDYGEMGKKTVVRRISKMLPRSTEVAQLLDEDEDVIDSEVVERDGVATPTSMERAKRRLQESSGIDMDFGAIPTPEAVPTAEEQEEIRSREQKQ